MARRGNKQQPVIKPTIILCFYINVDDYGTRSAERFNLIKDGMEEARNVVTDAPWLYIPVINENSRIECLYPHFRSNDEQLPLNIIEQLETINFQLQQNSFMCVDKPEQFKINKKEI